MDNFFSLTSEQMADVYSLYYSYPISFEDAYNFYTINDMNMDIVQKKIEESLGRK